jgi:hypothetical protein
VEGDVRYPHRIRLRGPWECEPLACADSSRPLPPPRRMTLPCRWSDGGLPDFAGRVRFRRRFGYPGRIDDIERVWLTFAGVTGRAGIHLNRQLIEAAKDHIGGFEHEITPLLSPRNELLVEVEAGIDGGLWGEVALEIRRTAFLRSVRISLSEGRLHVEGEIAGSAARPLELYVVLDRSTVAYGVAEASQKFALASEPMSLRGIHGVRVDLVDGATVWYTLEQGIDMG